MYNPDDEETFVEFIGKCKFFVENSASNGGNGSSNRGNRNREDENSGNWFENYINRLNFSETAVSRVKAQSEEFSDIINKSTDLFENKKVWSEGRLRKGMVVGSIQSGKTASMMGVIGNCLDNNTKIIILLSGTKISLWHQTLVRIYEELDSEDKYKAKIRFLYPKMNVINKQTNIDYSTQEHTIRKSLEKEGKVLLFVIPKIPQHIIDLSSVIHSALNKSPSEVRHMLVIDDESDDSSILDSQKRKTIPYLITRIWAGNDQSKRFDTTANENLFATYLAYTATPQANILQVESNPLSPRDFIFAIDTPSDKKSEITYYEPKGMKNYYTGGEIFYEQNHMDLIQILDYNQNGSVNLSDGLRAYIVGAAINMLSSGKRYSHLQENYKNLEAAKKAQIPVYSMVYHPTALTDDHFLGKQEMIHWLNNGSHENFEFDPNNKSNQTIEPGAFKNHFIANEEEWSSWIRIFNKNIKSSNKNLEGSKFPEIKDLWPEIKAAIIGEIIPNIKIKVINSKAGGESRPRFIPQEDEEEKTYVNTPDNLSIFVAGNVLSRGLTIERLAVTIFARESSDPASDTQMQMQRWFGYRGEILPFCRVFMTANQLDLFRGYHADDKSLKERISLTENRVDEPLEQLPYILEGLNYKSTSKTSVNKLPLRPLSHPEFGILEPKKDLRESNIESVKKLIKSMKFESVGKLNEVKGYVSSEPISSTKIADFLDSLQFTHHNPSADHPEYSRWENYANTYGADYFSKVKIKSQSRNLVSTGRCPYTIAAYLRFWEFVKEPDNALKNDLFVFPESIMWRDIMTKNPDFFVTVRSGSKSDYSLQSLDSELKIKLSHRSRNGREPNLVNNVWGTASGTSNQYDDRLFDYHKNNYTPVPKKPSEGMSGTPDGPRPSHHPGHMAIYFIEDNNGDINIGIGIALPTGSPSHIRSMSGN